MTKKYLVILTVSIGIAVLFIFQKNAKEPAYELIWEDDFKGNYINTDYWSVQQGNGCPDLCGWGNNELQYYTDDSRNVRVEDGILVIEAHKQVRDSSQYTSARILTRGKLEWKYGRMEMRAKLPTGRGTWMAFWMLPTLDRDVQWPMDGEIDIVEHVGYNPGTVYGAIHTQKYNGMSGTQKVDSLVVGNVDNDFHTYALKWTKDEFEWYVDGQLLSRLEKGNEDEAGWPFDQFKYHLIINLAIGGDWGGKMGVAEDVWPQRLEVDYVRYYQLIQ